MNILFFKNISDNITILGEAANADFVWIDVTREEITHDFLAWQETLERYGLSTLDEYHLSDVLNLHHPSSFDLTQNYELLIFRKLLSSQAESDSSDEIKLHTTPISFILTDNLLVTVRDADSQTLINFQQRIQQPMLLKNRLPSSSLELSLRILNVIIDKYLDLRAPLTERIKYWQTELLQGSHRFSHWQQLLSENLALQELESLCEEQCDALQELKDNYLDQQDTGSDARRDLILVRMNDLIEHATRVQNHSSRLELALKSAVDLHFSATANQTNETMRFLAILTAIFAPLTLLTGVYGMNFDIMPGLHNPDGFWLMILGMVFTSIGLLYYFYRRSLVGRGKRSVTQLLVDKADL